MLFSNYSIAKYDKTSTYFYAVEGSILFFFNLFLVYRILSRKYHRAQKDSMLLAGCLIFDMIFGLTYMCSGIYRIPCFFLYEYFPAVSKWECIGTPAILFIIITPTAGIFAFITSLDRFYCAMFPIKYIKLRVRYAVIVITAPYIIALFPIIKAIVGSYPYRFVKEQPMTCNLNDALTRENFSILRLLRVIFTLSCVIVYVPIAITMYKNIREHYQIANYSERTQRKLLRMTITIALITSNTILMFTVPDIILLINPAYTTNIFYMMNLNKGVINLIIFLATQRTLRNILLGKPDASQQTPSVRIIGRANNAFDSLPNKSNPSFKTNNVVTTVFIITISSLCCKM